MRATRASPYANLISMTADVTPIAADGPKSLDMERFSARRPKGGRDNAVARIAEDQHGVVALGQLAAVGLSHHAIQVRAEAGRLHRVHQGVYAVGHPLLSQEGHWMAAVLACGSEAVLSHRSAAALWGLRPDSRAKIDVTAPGRRGRSPAGIAAHRHGHLRHDDTEVVDRIRCTSVARTLLDLAAVVSVPSLGNAIARAEILCLFDLVALREAMARSRGRRGVARLRLAIEAHDPRSERANPGLERRFLALCGSAGLPLPEVNAPIDIAGGKIVADFLWRSRRLIVETDDRKSHGTVSAFERDRRRDQRLTLAGWRVIRCTWRQVTGQPEELARTLRALLAPAGRNAAA